MRGLNKVTVKDSAFYLEKFKLIPKSPNGKEVLKNINPVNQPAIQKHVETLKMKA